MDYKRILVVLLFLGVSAPTVRAQITLGTDGNVAVGSEPVNSDRKMNVWFGKLTSNASVIYARYSGVGNYNANAVFGRATNTAGFGYGGTFYGGSHGVRSFADLAGTGIRYGVHGTGSAGTTNYGVYGMASGGTTAYGIYGTASGASTNYAGFFNGNVTVTGTVTEGGSDSKLKEEVTPLAGTGLVERLMAVNPVSYRYKTDPEYADMHLPEGIRFGMLAQELEAVFPELVTNEINMIVPPAPGEGEEEDPSAVREITFKAINYTGLIPVLIQAIKEQQARIDALEALLEANGIR